jgi:hypothetical protein
MQHNHVSPKILLGTMVDHAREKISINYPFGSFISEMEFFFLLALGAGKVVSTPTKVDCLTDFRIKMVALGSEHSIAVTGD